MPVRALANDEFRKPGQFGGNSSGDLIGLIQQY
jgi:hypothetical protein